MFLPYTSTRGSRDFRHEYVHGEIDTWPIDHYDEKPAELPFTLYINIFLNLSLNNNLYKFFCFRGSAKTMLMETHYTSIYI